MSAFQGFKLMLWEICVKKDLSPEIKVIRQLSVNEEVQIFCIAALDYTEIITGCTKGTLRVYDKNLLLKPVPNNM